MSTLHELAPQQFNSLTNVELMNGQDTSTPLVTSDSWSAGFRGIYHGAAVRTAQALTLGVGGIANLISEESGDLVFEQLQNQQEYWAKSRSEDLGYVDQVLYGFGDVVGSTLGGLAGGGISRAAAATAINISMPDAAQMVAEGKPIDAALAIGGVRGGISAIGVSLPFSIPLLRGSGALSATAQRLGYAVGSNVVLGGVARYSESKILKNYGYDEEAAHVNWADPRAIGTDVVLGLAFGGLARWRDTRAAARSLIEPQEQITGADVAQVEAPIPYQSATQQIENAINSKLAQLEEIKNTLPFRRGEQKQLKTELHELEYQLARIVDEDAPVNAGRVLEYRQLLQRENPKLKAREAIRQAQALEQNERDVARKTVQSQKDKLQSQIDAIGTQLSAYETAKAAEGNISRINQRLKDSRSIEDRLNAIDEPLDSPLRQLVDIINKGDERAILQARAKLTTDVVDAALLNNMHLIRADSATGRPKNLQDHYDALDHAEQVLLNKAHPNDAIFQRAETVEDPKQIAQLAEKMRLFDEELTPLDRELANEPLGQDYKVSDNLPKAKLMFENAKEMDDFAFGEKGKHVMDTVPDDVKVIDIETGKEITMKEFRAANAAKMKEAEDLGDTVKNLASCMLRSGQ